MKKLLALRLTIGAVVVGALGWFAYANMDQTIELRFGFFTLIGISLPVVLYGAVVLGMLAMLAVGIRNDLRTRSALKRYDQIASDVLADIEADEPDVQEVQRRA